MHTYVVLNKYLPVINVRVLIRVLYVFRVIAIIGTYRGPAVFKGPTWCLFDAIVLIDNGEKLLR